MVLSQAADNMAEAMIDLVNLSKVAWKATNGNTEKQATKQRMDRARQPDGCAALCTSLTPGLHLFATTSMQGACN